MNSVMLKKCPSQTSCVSSWEGEERLTHLPRCQVLPEAPGVPTPTLKMDRLNSCASHSASAEPPPRDRAGCNRSKGDCPAFPRAVRHYLLPVLGGIYRGIQFVFPQKVEQKASNSQSPASCWLSNLWYKILCEFWSRCCRTKTC